MDADRLRDIKEEFENLLEEARQIVRKKGTKFDYERAKAYWINPIENALTSPGMGQGSMEETIETLDCPEPEEPDDPLEAICEVADEIGGSVRTDYSGRGMYGKKCVGIDCRNATECIELAASKGIKGARQDNMGLDMIVYWPHIQAPIVPSEVE